MPTKQPNKYRPVMTYMEPSMVSALKKFSRRNNTSMAQAVREAVDAKMASGDPFTSGFNSGVSKAIDVVGNLQAAKLSYPSGKTVGALVQEEIAKLKLVPSGKDV